MPRILFNSFKGALNTLSSYSKAVNTAHSQSFVSRTDYTNNPGLIAHPIAPVIAGSFLKLLYSFVINFLSLLNQLQLHIMLH